MQDQAIEGYRLSPQQERLWLLQQDGAGVGLPQRAACTILIEGELSPEVLREALSKVVEQHEILRTGFELLPAMTVPVQAIADYCSLEMHEHDLSELGADAQEAWLESELETMRRERDGATSPLSVSLVKLSTRRHLLGLSLPALCVDRIGIANLVHEVAAAVGACTGVENGQPAEPMQYADVAEILNELLESEDTQAGRNYWRDQDFSAFKLGRLAYARHARDEQSFELRSANVTFNSETFAQVVALARKFETTTAAFLLACWQTLLWRLTGEAEIVVGATYDCRTYDRLDKSIGLFAKSLPISVPFQAGTYFSSILLHVSKQISERAKWQDYFAWEQPGGAGSNGDESSYFPFAFEFANAHRARRVGNLRFTIISEHVVVDRFDIKLTCHEQPDHSLRAELTYDAGLFKENDINRLARWLEHLFESIIRNPHTAVDRLEILDDEERRQLLVDFNRTTAAYGPEKRLHELVEEQVARTPQQVAVVFEEEELSYDELNRRANQLAHHLQKLGVGPEVPVGILVDRSLEMVMGMLGILKAGGAYVPLDPDYPQERLAFMVEDAGVAVLLTLERFVEVLPQTPARVVCLDSDWGTIAGESEENPDSIISGDNLAYVIYTSGSTGKPKGVMITHRAIVNRLLWMQTSYALTPADRVLQKTVISFDASVWELFVPLLAGAQIILARPGGHKDSKYLVEAVRQQRVTTLQLVPSMLAVLVEEPELDQCLSLRQMWCGGEALSAELARRFHQRSRAVLHNLYGPTEASIDATHCDVERESEGQAFVPIGRPIGNMQCHILDRHLQPVPPGVAGELFIGGVGLARGYWKRADLTAEKFIPNPYGEASTRLYRTGDLARYLPGGNIEFLGRADQQVKVRGYRIELGEIEALLTQHREVRTAVVVAREASDGEKRLVAYIVPEQGNASPASNGMHSYVLPNQLEIFHLNKNETDLLFKEIFQDQVYLKHGVTLNDGDTVFDVGANISFFTLFVHQRCRDARVYAFEPLPPIFQVLQANVNNYGLNTTLFKCGLGKESGTASFTFYPKSSAMSGLYADVAEDERVIRAYMSRQDESLTEYADELMAGRLKSERYDCQVRTLSEIIAEQKIAQIDLLKIDVEKSELDVLEGIKESDWRKIKQIVIEVHDIQGRLTRISELLKSRGYRLTVEQDSAFDVKTGLYNIYAIHSSRQEAQGKPSGQTLRPVRSLAGLSIQEVNEYLRDKLPEYMVPSAIVMLGELPLTANGKVDRRALPEPLPTGMGDNEQVAARTPLEEILVAIWRDMLQVDAVGVHDNFFELGGHSLLATRLISRLRHQLSVEVPLHTLFETPTISGFAARMEQLLGFDGGSGSLPELVVGARPERLPLSYAQERLWFIDRLQPHSAAYNLPLAVRLRGALNFEALRRSLQRVIDRHESLRTTFVMEDGESYQVVADQLLLELPVVDVSGLDAAERERHVAQLLAAQASEGFDLSRGPLLRAQIIKLAEEEHIAVLTMHHIISDGWSLGVLIRELTVFYNAAVDKHSSSELSTLPLQYADYALWQKEWLTGGALAAQLNYWREQLAGAPVLELPNDKPRPVMQSMRGGHEAFRVSAELTEQLRALALREGATLFMVLLAVFEALLARYSGQRDLVVGTPIANRNRYETEELIGFFVNMLALRVKLHGQVSFRELVRQVRKVTLGAYAHQDVPFEKLVEELQPERDTSRQPIVQAMFVMQNAPQEALRLKGLEVSGAGVGAAVSKYDLSLAVEETRDGLVCVLEYCTDLFEAETIRRMSEHWQRLCEEVVRDSEQSIWEMKMLGAKERKQLVTEWNDTAVAYVEEKRIHELIEEQALLRPEAPAVIAEDGELSYCELNRQANQLAHYLRGLGVGPEVRVGICLERSLDMIVSLLAVLKAGGAYVPLDPDYPRERLSFMVADSSVSLLLTQQALSENLFPHNQKLICVDTDGARWKHERQSNPDVKVEANNLAYVIFTSGSTGRPKGAMNSHRAITNRLLWMQQAFALTPADAVMQKTPFSFDVSVWEFFWPLMTGARLVMARPGGHQDPAYLVQLIDEHKITVLHFVPSMLELFIEERRVATACRSVREVICSGEALRYAVQERFFERLPQARLANLYGPTETAVDVTSWQCERETQRQLVPIGRPIANTQMYIVDERMQPVPIGVAGELLIGGMGVGRGYVASPELTADRFIPDPFSSAGGQRLYRSGDLTRYRDDGNIEYLGRLDHQIKLRGFRIELGEIENALSRHPQVSNVAVIAHEDKDGNKRLIAYIVANMDHALEVADLKNFLRQNLPDYMVPTDFILLDELPLTPNGKLDRRALPLNVSSRSSRKEDFIAPRNELETGLAEIWKELLGVTTIGVKDNFFDIGGHSLLAVRLMARIQQRFDRELPLSTVFQGATIEYLAEQLGKQIEPKAWSPLVAIQPKGSRPPFFCVHAIGGNVLTFYYLARYLAPEQPLYGLEAPRLHEVEDTFLTIEEYAARYLVAVREIQPVGPYLLGGYSFGGNVAFEMAQQLQAQGQETAFLAIFDTASPSVFNSLPPTDDEVDLLVGLAWAEARSRDKKLLLSAEHLRSLEPDARLQYFLDEIKKADITPLDLEITMLQRFLTGFRVRHKALRNYQPGEIYKGRITLFRCEEQDPETRKSLEKAGLDADDPLYGWARHSSQPVEAHVIAGHHNRMFFDPYIENLARNVTACLERAQRNGASDEHTKARKTSRRRSVRAGASPSS